MRGRLDIWGSGWVGLVTCLGPFVSGLLSYWFTSVGTTVSECAGRTDGSDVGAVIGIALLLGPAVCIVLIARRSAAPWARLPFGAIALSLMLTVPIVFFASTISWTAQGCIT